MLAVINDEFERVRLNASLSVDGERHAHALATGVDQLRCDVDTVGDHPDAGN